MHERAIVSRTALELESLAGSIPVTEVTLATAPDTPVEVVEEAWRSASAGTSFADAVLTCVVRDHGLQCLNCGANYRGDKLSVCPACHGNGLIVEPSPEVALVGWSPGGVVA